MLLGDSDGFVVGVGVIDGETVGACIGAGAGVSNNLLKVLADFPWLVARVPARLATSTMNEMMKPRSANRHFRSCSRPTTVYLISSKEKLKLKSLPSSLY
jgi:hypothetical protein